MKRRQLVVRRLFLFSFLVLAANMARGKDYDPLAIDPNFQAQMRDLTAHDDSRNRDIPLRIYLPASNSSAPVVLFSHGLGGSRAGSKFLGQQWSARGYVAVFLQHPGSDETVWKDLPRPERMDAMRQAASLENFLCARAMFAPSLINSRFGIRTVRWPAGWIWERSECRVIPLARSQLKPSAARRCR